MRYLLRRIGFYLVAFWAAITLNFLIPRLMPGDPFESLVGRFRTQITIEQIHALQLLFGVHNQESEWAQYWQYLTDLAHGQLGTSFTFFPTPVSDVIGGGLKWTVMLVGVATILSFVIGTLLGMLAAWRRGTWVDNLLTPALTFLQAIPYFWLALILLYVLGLKLGWFPLYGAFDINIDPGWNSDYILSVLYHALLPALTIILSSMAGWMVSMRNAMLNTLSEDYVLMAQAKGLSERRVLITYAARNAILPNITSFALAIGFVIGGSLLTEIIFSYPGLGSILLQGVQAHDYPLMQAIFLLIAIGVLVANFLADLAYVFLDPRVRQEG
jgi:peptide/nickel transport system permease protein